MDYIPNEVHASGDGFMVAQLSAIGCELVCFLDCFAVRIAGCTYASAGFGAPVHCLPRAGGVCMRMLRTGINVHGRAFLLIPGDFNHLTFIIRPAGCFSAYTDTLSAISHTASQPFATCVNTSMLA